MSQTTAPPQTFGPGSVAPATTVVPPERAGPVGRAVDAFREGLAGTPGRLRLAAGLAIVAALVAAIGGGAALRERSQALADARDTAADVVLIQGIRTAMAEADANSTNSFLQGGAEPVDQRRAYVRAVGQASDDMARLARSATAADADLLGRVNGLLTRYTGDVEAARANNRQDLPVGASYLTVASGLLKDDNETAAKGDGIVPALTALEQRYTDRVDGAYDRGGRALIWFALAALIGLGGLIAVQVWLARRTRRFLNVPAAAGTLVLVVAFVAGTGVMLLAQSRANDVRQGDYRDAAAIGRSRVAAFDAKSVEALTLVRRGSGTAEDKEWATAFTTARAAAAIGGPRGALTPELDAYAVQHRAIRALDDKGDWDTAVTAATSQADGSANAAFQKYADDSETYLGQSATAAFAGLDDAGRGLLPVGLLVLLAGLAAAGGAWWGISLRLEEYR